MGIKIFIIKPGILISQWIAGSGGTIPDGLIPARSDWTDVSKVTHFEFDFQKVGGGDSNNYKKKILPATKKQITAALRKTDEDRNFKDAFIGNRNDDNEAQKIMSALKYAISEWPTVAKGSGDIGRYSTIFRGPSTTSEYGGTFSALNSNGDYIWKFGTGFVRFTGLIRNFSWTEDHLNNIFISSLIMDSGNIPS